MCKLYSFCVLTLLLLPAFILFRFCFSHVHSFSSCDCERANQFFRRCECGCTISSYTDGELTGEKETLRSNCIYSVRLLLLCVLSHTLFLYTQSAQILPHSSSSSSLCTLFTHWFLHHVKCQDFIRITTFFRQIFVSFFFYTFFHSFFKYFFF